MVPKEGGRMTETARQDAPPGAMAEHRAAVVRLRQAYARRRRMRQYAWPNAPPTCSGSGIQRPARPRPETPARARRIRLRPRAERRPRRARSRRRRHDHLRRPVRRNPAARADAVGRPAAQDDHPWRRGVRARHRVHLAPQRHAARIGPGDGDPDRRRPGGHGGSGQRAPATCSPASPTRTGPWATPCPSPSSWSPSGRSCTCATSRSATRAPVSPPSRGSPPRAPTKVTARTSSTAWHSVPMSST